MSALGMPAWSKAMRACFCCLSNFTPALGRAKGIQGHSTSTPQWTCPASPPAGPEEASAEWYHRHQRGRRGGTWRCAWPSSRGAAGLYVGG
eukprot:12012577-Alexandrium_andersonii.AAC.1